MKRYEVALRLFDDALADPELKPWRRELRKDFKGLVKELRILRRIESKADASHPGFAKIKDRELETRTRLLDVARVISTEECRAAYRYAMSILFDDVMPNRN